MPTPLERDTIRWGILGPGRIARSFADDLALVDDAELVAVGSRSAERAAAFAADTGATRAHGSYQALVADPDVDVVYVASPHSEHLDHATLVLEAGKPVLVEKSLTLTGADGARLVELARNRDLFLMEAMWTACHPVVREVLRRLRSGEHGRVRELQASLGFVVDADPTDRLLDPALGGGVLLDMGVYPLTLAQLVLGDPDQQLVAGQLAPSGIDLAVAISARYPSGAVACLTASMTAWSPRTAWIATDTGRFDLPGGFHHPDHVVWTPYPGGRTVGEPVVVHGAEPVIGTGLGNEAAEVGRCLREGLGQSPLVPWEQTLTVLRQMDALRRQLGVSYPADRR